MPAIDSATRTRLSRLDLTDSADNFYRAVAYACYQHIMQHLFADILMKSMSNSMMPAQQTPYISPGQQSVDICLKGLLTTNSAAFLTTCNTGHPQCN